MRFVADMGVSRTTGEHLRDHGHDVIHLSEEGLHRLPDDEILGLALREQRIVLTFDLDFGDLLALGSLSLPSRLSWADGTRSSIRCSAPALDR